jgi:hypothetical protein
MTVDGAREDDLAGGIDGSLGGRQILGRRQRDDAAVADAHRRIEDFDGRDDTSAGDDEVEGPGGHDVFLTGSVI